MPLAAIGIEEIKRVLVPIWMEKPETAARLRGRLEAILASAKAEKLVIGENPATWRGNLSAILPGKRKVRPIQHHPALAYQDAPRFVAALRDDGSATARLLEFIILTACRFGEAAGATWEEIDLDTAIWTIPARRMKAGREHQVPLGDRALAILEALPVREGLVFPGRRGKQMSDVALAKAIRRHTDRAATVHSFRSTFRDWCGDCTSFPREIAEMCLAHAVGSEVEAAYRRATALERRRELMQAWSSYVAGDATAEVLPFTRRQATQ